MLDVGSEAAVVDVGLHARGAQAVAQVQRVDADGVTAGERRDHLVDPHRAASVPAGPPPRLRRDTPIRARRAVASSDRVGPNRPARGVTRARGAPPRRPRRRTGRVAAILALLSSAAGAAAALVGPRIPRGGVPDVHGDPGRARVGSRHRHGPVGIARVRPRTGRRRRELHLSGDPRALLRRDDTHADQRRHLHARRQRDRGHDRGGRRRHDRHGRGWRRGELPRGFGPGRALPPAQPGVLPDRHQRLVRRPDVDAGRHRPPTRSPPRWRRTRQPLHRRRHHRGPRHPGRAHELHRAVTHRQHRAD